MKLTYTQHNPGQSNEFFEVVVNDPDVNNIKVYMSYAFDTKKEVNAFCSGFFAARSVVSSMVQLLPMTIGEVKAMPTPEK